MTVDNRLESTSYHVIFLAEALDDPDFSLELEVTISVEDACKLLRRKYRAFNLENLDGDTVLEMASKALILAQLSKKASDLKGEGQLEEAVNLEKKVNLIADPKLSRSQTPLSNVLWATHGNLDMASSFLGIKPEIGRDWLNFIVRTWGIKPSNFR